MNVSGSRSELILDLLSLDGWLPTQNATTLGSTRVKELTGVVENGRTFRNVTIQPENSAPIVKSPRKQGHAKSETISTVAVKGMVLSVHDTYSTIKRMPARMEITASKDETDNQSLDHLVNHSLRRIEEVLPTSNDLAQFFRQTMWPQSIETKPPPQTPIQFINVEPVSKTPLESTLNVTLAPWHFERLRSPEKMAVFHSSMQPKNSKVSIFGQQIIENVNSVVQNLQNGLDGDASLPDFPLNILSTKLCNEANEISILSRLKSTLDSTMDSTRSVATIAALAATLGDAKKKLGKAKGSKSKKKSADTKTNSGNADKKEKNKTKKKSNKAVKQLTDTGEYSDSTGNKAQEIDEISSCDSEDEMDPKGTRLKGVRGKKGGRDSDKDSNAEGNTDGASDGFGEGLGEGNQKTSVNLSEQQKKISYKKIAAKSVAKVDDGSFNIEAGMVSKSLTDSELVAKLKLTLTSAQKFAGNAAQLINAHEVLACADHYLGELKSRISGLGIVGYAERHMLVAFRQGSYKLMSSKGKMCMIMRMFPEAVDSYTRAFEFCDWMPEILFLRAQAHMKKGDITSAQKDLEAAKSIVRDGFVDKSQNPSQFQFQSNSYNAFVESLSDAIASAQSVITSFDDDEAHHENKKALKSQGQVQPKLAHVPVAISDGSGNNEQWPRNRVFMLAAEYDSMIHHGLSEEVIYKCDILLAEDNSNGLVWALRGRALLVLGRVEEGLKNINRSVACWGECYECRLYRALAYRQSDPSAAELDLDLCTQMSCCGAIVYILRASLKESTHRNSEAALDWELASRKDSSRRNEYRFRACKLLFEDNRRSDCLHMLERLRASSPHYIPTYLLLADLQVRMGNHKGALAGLSRALMMEPWNPLLFFKRAQVLLMKDRSEDSMRDLVMFFRLNGAVNHGIKNDDGNSVKAASRFEVSMIELHCKALISLQYWKDVILLLQQNEKLVAESCSLQVRRTQKLCRIFVFLSFSINNLFTDEF
jgi:tetratricopeptide (TPR) repeat protein